MSDTDANRRDRPRTTDDIRRYKRHTSYIEAAMITGTLVCALIMILTHLVLSR